MGNRTKRIFLLGTGAILLIAFMCFQTGNPKELKAIKQAVAQELEKEGIGQEDIVYLRVIHYAGLSASPDPDQRYSVQVSLWDEKEYRIYEWTSGTAADKTQGVTWKYSIKKY